MFVFNNAGYEHNAHEDSTPLTKVPGV